MLLFPLYFQQVRAEGALNAGLLVVPQGIGAMIMMPISGRLVDRGHAARLVPLGIVVIAGSMMVFTQLTDTTSYWTIGGAPFVVGLGMGMVGMPNMSIALKTLRRQDIARASTSLTIIPSTACRVGSWRQALPRIRSVRGDQRVEASTAQAPGCCRSTCGPGYSSPCVGRSSGGRRVRM